jgi:hypothetical protein
MSQIPRVTLDPANDEELLQECYLRCYNASDGRINDFRDSSVVTALYEGFVHAQANLLWYLNQLPEAVAFEVMRYSTQVERSDGTPAKGVLFFQLESPQATTFLIDTSYTIPYQDTYFTLDAPLVIPAGAYEASGAVTCARVGTKYNSAPFGIVITQTGITNLATIYNLEPISGGSDLEPLETTLGRMQRVIRQRSTLVSAKQYEDRAVELLGGGRALAVPLLSSNRLDTATGQVHMFLLGNDGKAPNTATLSDISSTLTSEGFVAAYCWASPVEFTDLNTEFVITVSAVSQELATLLYQALQELYSPLLYPFGKGVSVQDAIYKLRLADDRVTQVFSALINGNSLDIALPYRWSLPFLRSVVITLVDGVNSVSYTFGSNEGLVEGTGLDE